MTALAYYLLKVVLCSGILFLYYHLALRNKIFHQWNRFYLLSAVVLSLVLPLLQFRLFFETAKQNGAIQLVQSADEMLEEFVVISRHAPSPEAWLQLGYGAVCMFFLLGFLLSLRRIASLIRSHSVTLLGRVKFVSTRVDGTPFSFFRYIFWNENISLQSTTGQQIFQHEVVHVEEKHTLDKLFLQVVLIFFWCNPFFWLMRKELYFVHEFIADKKAVARHGVAAFAAMILQASYPQQFTALTNSFFQSPIKRRLAMLTKLQNPKLNYLSRIIVLPLVTLTVFAFTIRTKAAPEEVMSNKSGLSAKTATKTMAAMELPADTVPQKQIRSVNVQKNDTKKISKITINYTDGSTETLTEAEAIKRGLIKSPGAEKVVIGYPKGEENNRKTNTADPLLLLDGKEISKEEMSKLNPKAIEAVNVLKGPGAIEKYGEKGKNGVVEITLKDPRQPGSSAAVESSNTSGVKEVIIEGHPVPNAPTSAADDGNPVFSQTETPASVNREEWRQFLQKNLQPIIENAAAKGAKAGTYTVQIRFLIKKDGSVSDFIALNDPGYGFASQLLSVMPYSPKWKPAEQNGKPVTSYHTQPITLVIQEQ